MRGSSSPWETVRGRPARAQITAILSEQSAACRFEERSTLASRRGDSIEFPPPASCPAVVSPAPPAVPGVDQAPAREALEAVGAGLADQDVVAVAAPDGLGPIGANEPVRPIGALEYLAVREDSRRAPARTAA